MLIYLLDQALLLIVGVGIIIGIPHFWGPVMTLILESLTILSWGYLCRRILLLPIDLLCGRRAKQVHLVSQQVIDDYEFFRRRCSVEWKLYFGSKGKMFVLVPASAKRKEIDLIKRSQKDEYISITYYRFSKILLDWQPISPKSDQV
ncbi:MAG: hypothetical protein J1E60_01390 [Christensenellaceae bacterium]|nr:hypothetical protein [Christensenellaceae bacterium]